MFKRHNSNHQVKVRNLTGLPDGHYVRPSKISDHAQDGITNMRGFGLSAPRPMQNIEILGKG